jgi:SAM-dependent methyltransferase
MLNVYARREGSDLPSRLYRALTPPDLFVRNPHEPLHFPLGRWNLYVGGGGARPDGYLNIDLYPIAGVNVVANAQQLPFKSNVFQCIECDAVLEHVRDPGQVMSELTRVLAPGGHIHVVTPFCHPFHEYPKDFRRFTIDGLKLLAGNELDVVEEGWRTGPTATLLVFVLEYVKLWLPFRLWRGLVHWILGWLLFPLRYLDFLFFRVDRVDALGNHCFVWLRKPE